MELQMAVIVGLQDDISLLNEYVYIWILLASTALIMKGKRVYAGKIQSS